MNIMYKRLVNILGKLVIYYCLKYTREKLVIYCCLKYTGAKASKFKY